MKLRYCTRSGITAAVPYWLTRLLQRNEGKKLCILKFRVTVYSRQEQEQRKKKWTSGSKKNHFRFSRHWRSRLFRSKADIFTRLSNNTAKIRVVKVSKLAKTYVWVIQPRKKLHQLRKCGPARFSHVEFRRIGSTHVLRRFSQPISAGRVQMEAPAFSTLFSGLFSSI